MSHSVIIAAGDQTTSYALRSHVEEVDGFVVVDVADTTPRLHALVSHHDPTIVLVHEHLQPEPALQTVREIVARRPGTAVVVVAQELTADLFTGAMDAGARGVLAHPASHDELRTRLESAAEWHTKMRTLLTSDGHDAELGSRGRLVAVAGAKGGVGTTTVTAHLAHHAVTEVPGRSVCVVDLDLDGGDLASFLGITHRLDISDLAKVADDLSAQTVEAAIHRSSSGLSTLLGPRDIEDVGEVGDREAVLILSALRRQFDLLLVDCGSSVTPPSAAAVETADEVLLVTTPDVLALRGAHRVTERWKRVGAREPSAVKVLLNKVSRESDIQPDTASRLLPTAPLEQTLPDAFTVLQRGLNHQDPAEIRAKAWWGRIAELAPAVGVVPATEAARPVRQRDRRLLGRRRRPVALAEEGQATLEFSGLIATVLFLMILIWQIALWGVSAAYTSHAANEAAREAGIGASTQQVRQVAVASMPRMFRQNTTVSQTPRTVRVRGELPILLPAVTFSDVAFTSATPIVPEED